MISAPGLSDLLVTALTRADPADDPAHLWTRPVVIEIAVLLYLWATGLGCAGGIIDALRRWHRHQRALSRLITLGG